MKKIFTLLLAIVFISGCSLTDMKNTPTKKVEEYLSNYQTLSDDVLSDLDDMIDDMDNNKDFKDSYRDIMKKHYKDLMYEVKEETIDGDDATVVVEIEVTDYSDIMNIDKDSDEFKDDEGDYDETKYYDYQLDLLKNAKDKVKYTITFYLTKVDKEWQLQEPSNTDIQKIHGIYAS